MRMRTRLRRILPYGLPAFLLVGCFSIARAQSAPQDTIEKLIYGLNRTALIHFTDPEHRTNHIELTVNDPLGLDISPPSRDGFAYAPFDITSRRFGTYLVRMRFVQNDGLPEPDSGSEYVKVTVLDAIDAPMIVIDGPDITGTAEYITCQNMGTFANRVPFAYSPHAIYQEHIIGVGTAMEKRYWDVVYRTPPGRSISVIKVDPDPCKDARIVLDDGQILSMEYRSHTGQLTIPRPRDTVRLQLGEYISSYADGIHVGTTNGAVLRVNPGSGWVRDSAGLSGAYANAVIGDSTGIVYAATSKGLFVQVKDSTQWHRVPTLPVKPLSSIFIDRQHRFNVGAFDGTIHSSTDGGATWTSESPSADNGYMIEFSDDAFGNLYGVRAETTPPNRLYRKRDGEADWEEIGQSIRALSKDPDLYQIFKDISGDSTLTLGTTFGIFTSTNAGTDWAKADSGLSTPVIYGLVGLASGRSLISTNHGIATKGRLDSTWGHVYPEDGKRNGIPLFSDAYDRAYILGPQRFVDINNKPPLTYVSDDAGGSWTPDSAGIWRIPTIGVFHVSPWGTQIWGTYGSTFQSKPAEVYTKARGGEWTKDSAFPGTPLHFPIAYLTPDTSTTYIVLSLEGMRAVILKRKAPSPVWSYDTVGLGATLIYGIAIGKDGKLYAATEKNGVLRYDGTTWVSTSEPPKRAAETSTGLHAAEKTGASAIAIDSTGAVYAAFYSVDAAFRANRFGVYRSVDGGDSWTRLGLEGVNVSKLVALGDTAYALTDQGLYLLARDAASAVPIATHRAPTHEIPCIIAPNPFSREATLRFAIGATSHVRITLADASGAHVASIVDRVFDAGSHAIDLSPTSLASGVYYCRIAAGDAVAVRRVVVVR
jgi:hypothetical protein